MKPFQVVLFSVLGLGLLVSIVQTEMRVAAIERRMSASENSAAAAVRQFEKDIFSQISAAQQALEQRQKADAAAIRNDLRALPRDNFRGGLQKWGGNQ